MTRGSRFAALLLAVTSLVACGDDDDGGQTPTSSAPAVTVAPSGSDPTATGAPPAKLSDVRVTFTKVVDLEAPVALAAARNGDLYVAEQAGRVRLVTDGRVRRAPVLDIRSKISAGGERGLLGLALSPDERFLYVNYTDTDGDTHIVEYTTDGRNERELLFVEQPYPNHNGGGLAFGPDGYLYAALGDGGSGGDPQGNGQKLSTLLGKLLRIDPGGATDDEPYGIPEGNPFAERESARPEIWAYGLRNPWRFSFDRDTGDLWTGDVGQNAWEEIDFAPARSPGGENYGWNLFEGLHRYDPGPAPAGHVPPVYEYATSEKGNCAVIGGYVYRGTKIPALVGAYLFGDSCGGRVEGLRYNGTAVTDHAELGRVASPSSFGEDESGELYVLSLQGALYRIDPA